MRVAGQRAEALSDEDLAIFENEEGEILTPSIPGNGAPFTLESLPDRRSFEEEAVGDGPHHLGQGDRWFGLHDRKL